MMMTLDLSSNPTLAVCVRYSQSRSTSLLWTTLVIPRAVYSFPPPIPKVIPREVSLKSSAPSLLLLPPISGRATPQLSSWHTAATKELSTNQSARFATLQSEAEHPLPCILLIYIHGDASTCRRQKGCKGYVGGHLFELKTLKNCQASRAERVQPAPI